MRTLILEHFPSLLCEGSGDRNLYMYTHVHLFVWKPDVKVDHISLFLHLVLRQDLL